MATALRQYVDDYSRRNSTRVDLEVAPDLGWLPPHVELAIFRLVEQALETVGGGSASEGSRVKIRAASASGKTDMLLTVEGIAGETQGGVPALVRRLLPVARAPSLDIASMRERVGRIGGQLKIEASAGRSVVRAVVPVRGIGPVTPSASSRVPDGHRRHSTI